MRGAGKRPAPLPSEVMWRPKAGTDDARHRTQHRYRCVDRMSGRHARRRGHGRCCCRCRVRFPLQCRPLGRTRRRLCCRRSRSDDSGRSLGTDYHPSGCGSAANCCIGCRLDACRRSCRCTGPADHDRLRQPGAVPANELKLISAAAEMPKIILFILFVHLRKGSPCDQGNSIADWFQRICQWCKLCSSAAIYAGARYFPTIA